ncbi:fumarylacetoacetate hydrolase family protein [Schnuerera sp. xch1]|uniref:fumarylacetoacetate hydrolase family protein n=1 Tax=Schnuerera sp. xch1 TaxID=2874283 RepID=UPI001CBB6FDA|nr:fumarylacetoacetate hydrolase family protein [Schnuerera sp. xch1]MBZ2175495.1 fumarylacetoacetate hydrolase family protein [Schnuerera sp. xch1]
MKFVSYIYDGNEGYGVFNEDNISVFPMNVLLGKLNRKVLENLLEFIRTYSDDIILELGNVLNGSVDNTISIDDIKITAPIPYPRRNVFCLGKNYADHAMEVKSLPGGKAAVPDYPIYFTKVTDPAIGHMDKVIIPKDYTEKIDYEVELAIIIGKDGKDISPDDAEDYIFGYTIGNDISARDIQTKHVQWFKGKSLDTFTPMGPYIVDKSEISFPIELDINCKINGEIRQNSNTKNLIFDIPTIISDLSKGLTLRAGDIILTGTPSGVGIGFTPHKYLKSGDVVECYVEKIGSLVNYVK